MWQGGKNRRSNITRGTLRATRLYFRGTVSSWAVRSAWFILRRCAFDVRLTTGNYLIHTLYENAVFSTRGERLALKR